VTRASAALADTGAAPSTTWDGSSPASPFRAARRQSRGITGREPAVVQSLYYARATSRCLWPSAIVSGMGPATLAADLRCQPRSGKFDLRSRCHAGTWPRPPVCAHAGRAGTPCRGTRRSTGTTDEKFGMLAVDT